MTDDRRSFAVGALFHATRSELLRRAERRVEALEGAERALALMTNPAERRLLDKRLDELCSLA